MRKKTTVRAVLLLSGAMMASYLALATVVSSGPGVTLSDAEAAKIVGGSSHCLGIGSTTCTGTSCSSKTVFTFGGDKNHDPSGDAFCGGTSGCGLYYKSKVSCGTT
jgi:hypothetical protein